MSLTPCSDDHCIGLEPLGSVKTVPKLLENWADSGKAAVQFWVQKLSEEELKTLAVTQKHLDSYRQESFRQEVKILQLLREGDTDHRGHKRIIEMFHGEMDPKPTMILEFVEPFGFDLSAFMFKCYNVSFRKGQTAGVSIGVPLLAHLSEQLCDAVDYMQSDHVQVVHGDMNCNNVLITPEANIKVIDFGMAACKGEVRKWQESGDYVAPEVLDQEVPADYPQDMYGLGHIFGQYSQYAGPLPSSIAHTAQQLRHPDPKERMTVAALRCVQWMKDASVIQYAPDLTRQRSTVSTVSTESGGGTPTPMSSGSSVQWPVPKLPLKKGYALQVTRKMLKHLKDDQPTIGKAELMQAGVQVLYVDRRYRPLPTGAEKIVRVPGFGTEIGPDDWLYLGFPKGKSADTYIQKMAELAARSDTDPPDCIPVFFFFDEVAVPAFADNYALGPPLSAAEPKARNYLNSKYEQIHPPPSGFLHLRRNFGINLAGVRRDDELIFFPGPEFVLREGDTALFVRAVGADGFSMTTHTSGLLARFSDLFHFQQLALKREDVLRPLQSKDMIVRANNNDDCMFWAKVGGDGKDEEREKDIANEVKLLKFLTYQDQQDANSHVGRARIVRLVRYSDGFEGSPTAMTLELVKPFGFDMNSLMEKYKKEGKRIDRQTLAHLLLQLIEALQYMESKDVVHGSLKCGQLLVTRSFDIKVANFGDGHLRGESKTWPDHCHMAPEVKGQWAAADFAQDIYGFGWVLQELMPSVAIACQQDVQRASESTLAERAARRPLVEELRASAPWLSQGQAPESMPDVEGAGADAQIEALFLPGVAKQVDDDMLRLGNTIGKARVFDLGLLVLHVDRRFRDSTASPVPEDDQIVRVPGFTTEIAKGDWLYSGISSQDFVYGKKLFYQATEITSMETASLQEAMAEAVATPQCVGFRRDRDNGLTSFCSDKAGKSAENGRDRIDWYDKELQTDPLCHGPRKWIPYDEWPLPSHCDGYALGPQVGAMGPADLAVKYARLPSTPKGFLDLRNKFKINLAGVRRAGQRHLFPGADFVIQKGDIALLARVAELNGGSYPAYDKDLLHRFHAYLICNRVISALLPSVQAEASSAHSHPAAMVQAAAPSAKPAK